jgi:D-3-phosphoglycerate dehydrogenase / 2-oxoglutarate reductase
MKVLIVDEMHPSIVQMPLELGLEVDYLPSIAPSEVLMKVKDYEGLIIRSKFEIDENFLVHASNLKFIGRAGAGLDLIDTEACKKRGIAIFAANEGNRIAVAEHVIGMLLCLLNKIHIADQQVRNKVWKREENRGEELFGKTVGIIGYGNNGKTTAERLAAFGCKVLAYDTDKTGFTAPNIYESTLAEIYHEADILSLHIPLTDLTYQMVNADFINRFKKNIYLCNISRGEVLVLDDLVEALKSGKIKGAVLDVLENEKLNTLNTRQEATFNYLKEQTNVVFTPHIAGWTHQSYVAINQVLKEKIAAFLKGYN